MADGEVLIDVDIDAKETQKKLDKLKRDISKMENSLSTKKAKQTTIEKELHNADQAVERTHQKIKQLETELEKMRGVSVDNSTAAEVLTAKSRIEEITAELREQRTEHERLAKEAGGVAKKYENATAEVERITAELDKAKTEAGELQQEITGIGRASNKTSTEIGDAGKKVQRFKKRLIELAKSALIFSVLTKGLTGLRDWLGKTVRANDEAAAAIARLKGALATLAAPIFNSIMPALTSFINLLARVVATISMFVATATGETYANSIKAAEGLEAEKEALEGVGGAAKDAAKQLASFDEINKFSSQSGGGGGGASIDEIKPLFDAKPFEGKLVDFVMDLAVKINDLLFEWDKKDFSNKADKWITALSGILGVIIGGAFGGISGAIIGLVMGLAIGVITCEFTDEMKDPDEAKKTALKALGAIIGTVIGFKYGGITGAVIGLTMGLAISISGIEFLEGDTNERKAGELFDDVLTSVLTTVIGAKYGGLKGALIGLALGLSIEVISAEFIDSLEDEGASRRLFDVALTSVLAAVAGAKWFGWKGALAGLAIGLFISWQKIEYDDTLPDGEKANAAVLFHAAIGAILGAIVGQSLGVPGVLVGSVLGIVIGVSIAFDNVDFSDATDSKMPMIAAVMKSVLTAILVAAAVTGIGGPVLGIAAGVITLGMSLMINITDVGFTGKVNDINSPGGVFAGSQIIQRNIASDLEVNPNNIPALATGAVIPPNKKFLAMLGDQKSGTNIEAPLSTIEQAVRNAMGSGFGGKHTVIMEIDGREFGRVTYDAYNRESQRLGVSLG